MTTEIDIGKGQVNGSVSVNVERRGGTIEQLKTTLNTELLKADYASEDLEFRGRTIEHLKYTLNTELLKADSPNPATCCIFRVPEVLRRQKPQAYEPDIVSIGPFHRGADAKFKLVEKVKKWYLKCLLSRAKSITLDELIERMKELEEVARDCYSDPCDRLDQNDFIEMLILDGCFLIELFRKTSDVSIQDEHDPIFNASFMLQYLYHDLLLLENQLPWFVLEFFYNLIESRNDEPLSKLVINFFRNSAADQNIFSYRNPESNIKFLHIVDLIRTSLVQEYIDERQTYEEYLNTPGALQLQSVLPHRLPSAATLSDAGVRFTIPEEREAGSPRCILNIKFEDGVFIIPPLAIDERTDPLFRNLMAYEQCYHSCYHYITSYAFLLSNLINTAKDVDLLCEKGIVANRLGTSDDVSKFFNLYDDNISDISFTYRILCTKVNEYYLKSPCIKTWIRINRWMETARRDYFDSPWSIIALVTGFVILVFTFLQTLYTIMSYYHPSR